MSRILSFVVLVVFASAAVFAQSKVTVENTKSNPVPINVENTPTVKVSGTVPVSGSVSATITNAPSVSVSNLPTGTAGPAAASAVLVRELDNPALQPFHQRLFCTMTRGTGLGLDSCTATLNIPMGKELVIEYLQVSSFEFSGAATSHYQLQTIASGQMAPYFFAPGTRAASNFVTGDHTVRIYADPGSTLTWTGLGTANSGNVVFEFTISGYMVKVP